MEVTFRWCHSGYKNRIQQQLKINNRVFITLCINISIQAPVWPMLRRKVKKENKKANRVSCSTQYSYDPCEYAKNFDQGLMMNDQDDLSRSFSARFAVPTTVFRNGNLYD
ncbi:hypothetical protein R6Q57_002169 [Mikania cordata]